MAVAGLCTARGGQEKDRHFFAIFFDPRSLFLSYSHPSGSDAAEATRRGGTAEQSGTHVCNNHLYDPRLRIHCNQGVLNAALRACYFVSFCIPRERSRISERRRKRERDRRKEETIQGRGRERRCATNIAPKGSYHYHCVQRRPNPFRKKRKNLPARRCKCFR